MQSNSQQQKNAICTVDAATGLVIAGPVECRYHQSHASGNSFRHKEPSLSPKADAALVPQLSLAVSVMELPSLRGRTVRACPMAGKLGSWAAGWTQTGLAVVLWYGSEPSLFHTVHSGADGRTTHTLVLEPRPDRSTDIWKLSFGISPCHAHAILCYSMAGMEQLAPRSSIINLADGTETRIPTMESVISVAFSSWSPSGQHFSLEVTQHVGNRSRSLLGVYALENAAPIAHFTRDGDDLTWSLDGTMCLYPRYLRSQHTLSLIILSGRHWNTVRHCRLPPALCNALAPAGDVVVRIFKKGLAN